VVGLEIKVQDSQEQMVLEVVAVLQLLMAQAIKEQWAALAAVV
jgi:phosphoribosylformylglycinamidine (FGAM) synthase-like enzyme